MSQDSGTRSQETIIGENSESENPEYRRSILPCLFFGVFCVICIALLRIASLGEDSPRQGRLLRKRGLDFASLSVAAHLERLSAVYIRALHARRAMETIAPTSSFVFCATRSFRARESSRI